MTAVKWWEGRMAALDTETTGPNPQEDRIVTAAIVHHNPAERPRTISWIVDPGCDIPEGAAAVHGWTTDRLRARLDGKQAVRIHNGVEMPLSRDSAMFEIAAQCGSVMGNDVPLIVANAPFDLTLVECELLRHDIDTLSSRPAGVRGVVDPMVLDKAWDQYRKNCYKAPGCRSEDDHHECGGCRGGQFKCGGCGVTDRKLTSLCRHYNVPHVGAHDASGDALAALRLTTRLASLWPEIARWRLPTLHQHQITWRKQQADGLRAFFDKKGIEHDGIDPGWPLESQRRLEVGAA